MKYNSRKRLRKHAVIVVFILLGVIIGFFIAPFFPLSQNNILPDPIQKAIFMERPVEFSQEVLERPNFPIRCEIENEEYISTTYFLNGMIRATNFRFANGAPLEGDATDAIIRDGKTWTWHAAMKKGQVIETPDAGPQEYVSQLEGASVPCVTNTVDEQLFEVPTDITFVVFETDYEEKIRDAVREGIEDALRNYR